MSLIGDLFVPLPHVQQEEEILLDGQNLDIHQEAQIQEIHGGLKTSFKEDDNVRKLFPP